MVLFSLSAGLHGRTITYYGQGVKQYISGSKKIFYKKGLQA